MAFLGIVVAGGGCIGEWELAGARCQGRVLGALHCWHPLLCCSALHLPLPLHPQIQAANPVSRALFNTAYRYKQAAMQRGDLSGGRLAPLWDRLVFSKVRARVGGGCLLRPAGCLLVACLVGGEGLYCLRRPILLKKAYTA